MMQPKRIKHRKTHTIHGEGLSVRGSTLAFGEWGLKSVKATQLTARQIEAARRAIVRYLRRGGQVWIRVYPDRPITRKPLETRMGSGKGNVEYWVAPVKRGRVLFELAGVQGEVAREALRLAARKLPVETKIIGRADFFVEPREIPASTI